MLETVVRELSGRVGSKLLDISGIITGVGIKLVCRCRCQTGDVRRKLSSCHRKGTPCHICPSGFTDNAVFKSVLLSLDADRSNINLFRPNIYIFHIYGYIRMFHDKRPILRIPETLHLNFNWRRITVIIDEFLDIFYIQ